MAAIYDNFEAAIAEQVAKIPEGCYAMDRHFVKGPCVFGTDLRPGVFDLTIADAVKGSDGQAFRPIFIGKLDNPIQVMAVCLYYRPVMGLVDARPDFTATAGFQAKLAEYGIDVWRCQYNTNPDSSEEEYRDEEQGLITIHRSMSIDKVWMAIRSGRNVILPKNFSEIEGGKFKRELCGAYRTFEEYRGKTGVLFWKKRADHDDALHSLNYCYKAWEMAGLNNYGDGASLSIVVSEAKPLPASGASRPNPSSPDEIEALVDGHWEV